MHCNEGQMIPTIEPAVKLNLWLRRINSELFSGSLKKGFDERQSSCTHTRSSGNKIDFAGRESQDSD